MPLTEKYPCPFFQQTKLHRKSSYVVKLNILDYMQETDKFTVL